MGHLFFATCVMTFCFCRAQKMMTNQLLRRVIKKSLYYCYLMVYRFFSPHLSSSLSLSFSFYWNASRWCYPVSQPLFLCVTVVITPPPPPPLFTRYTTWGSSSSFGYISMGPDPLWWVYQRKLVCVSGWVKGWLWFLLMQAEIFNIKFCKSSALLSIDELHIILMTYENFALISTRSRISIFKVKQSLPKTIHKHSKMVCNCNSAPKWISIICRLYTTWRC